MDRSEAAFKFLIKLALSIHALLYRLSGGKWGNRVAGWSVLLLTTKGTKSGKEFTAPLGSLQDIRGYVIASNGGREAHSSWFYHLSQSPNASIQIENQHISVDAQVAQGESRAMLWSKLIQASSMYEKYRTRTTREIPIVIPNPSPAK